MWVEQGAGLGATLPEHHDSMVLLAAVANGTTLTQQPAIVVLAADNSITLPDEIAQQFHPADRFVVVPQGDTLILKRLTSHVSDIVASTPEEAPPLSLDEISDIVHELRSQRRHG